LDRVNSTQPLPHEFVKTILALHGAGGQAWLDGLPSFLQACERRWSVRLEPPFSNLTYNYVAAGVRSDGQEIILKAGVPNKELTTEIEALRFLDGQGAVALLEADASRGILLLERLLPGTPLSQVTDDEQATAIAAEVMGQLWRPAPASTQFPTVADWGRGLQRLRQRFDGGSGPFPDDLVTTAERLYAELLQSSGQAVLLHGDLHHDNILAAERHPWLVIDPKGVIGEREYEIGAFVRNPFPRFLSLPDVGGLLQRRLDQFSATLGFDRQRLHAWSVAQSVLSAWWDYEDNLPGWPEQLQFTRLLMSLANL
jgi:streptomycin 6-kinase